MHMTNFAQMTPEEREAYAERVAVLNDRLRASPNNNLLGRIVMTQGIQAMIEDSNASPFWFDQGNLLRIVRDYSDFTGDNDPYGQRDFGIFDWKETRCYWKIDYYDQALVYGSDDPADPSVTYRILTILRADEY